MPAMFFHFAFIEELYRISSNLPYNKIDFMAGNLIPDMSATKKTLSHYRKASYVEGFVAPDIERVKKDLFFPNDPIKFGMYTHLWLDKRFIENVLIPSFIWDLENMRVINPRNGKSWSANYFFSSRGMYSSYTEVKTFMLRDNLIPLEEISKIPTILPLTGIPIFDIRRKKTWRKQLDEHLSKQKKYTGNIFVYPALWQSFQELAEEFIYEHNL